MDTVGCWNKECMFLWRLLLVVFQLFFLLTDCKRHNSRRTFPMNETDDKLYSAPPVRLLMRPNYVVISNGIVSVTLSSPEGLVTGIQYNGIDNLLSISDDEQDRGYWDAVWFDLLEDKLQGTEVKIIAKTEDQVEISFIKAWNKVSGPPINVDKRFIMLRGSSGFYTYSIFERLQGWPGGSISELRIAFKLQQDMFKYMAISDRRQTIMPTTADRLHGVQLDIKEAVLLTNPSDPALKGEVDDKYQYTSYNKDSRVHGWVSDNRRTGFWMITPSDEFRRGGPLGQDLTSHCCGTVLSMFFSVHYTGRRISIDFANGEPWKKVFGPVFIYLNSGTAKDIRQTLWQDAKAQMLKESASWPYSFPLSIDFLKSIQRGSLTGQLQVLDRYNNKNPVPAAFAYVGLAPMGEVGSWEIESKGYQFWTQADEKGNFVIKEIRSGIYDLYSWVPGFIGDYKYHSSITITPGSDMKLYGLLFEPPRTGPTIWEIGIPDRLAAEFYVPDPEPNLVNRLYFVFDKFRQYGLWRRYTDLYPKNDLVFTIGVSNYAKDWFYAHVPRKIGPQNYTATTWQIIFQLKSVEKPQIYTLRLALASAQDAELQVRVNDGAVNAPYFTTQRLGENNAIARHGIHGLNYLFEMKIPGNQLFIGRNTLFLTQTRDYNPWTGIMYDYIRLEGPPAMTR